MRAHFWRVQQSCWTIECNKEEGAGVDCHEIFSATHCPFCACGKLERAKQCNARKFAFLGWRENAIPLMCTPMSTRSQSTLLRSVNSQFGHTSIHDVFGWLAIAFLVVWTIATAHLRLSMPTIEGICLGEMHFLMMSAIACTRMCATDATHSDKL